MKHIQFIQSIAALFFFICTPIFILILCGEKTYNNFTQQWGLPFENIGIVLFYIIAASFITILGTIIFQGLKK